MADVKHTPGTWAVVRPAGDFDNISVCAFEGDPRDGIMADVIAEITSIEDEADAHLIAAAADLLTALKRLMAAEREAARTGREALLAARFTGPSQAEAFAAQTRAGVELTDAWAAARAAIIKAEAQADV